VNYTGTEKLHQIKYQKRFGCALMDTHRHNHHSKGYRRTIHPRLTRRVGNRWVFAVEFEIQDTLPKTWNESWGSLWL